MTITVRQKHKTMDYGIKFKKIVTHKVNQQKGQQWPFFYYNHLLTIEINTILRKYIYNIYNI